MQSSDVDETSVDNNNKLISMSLVENATRSMIPESFASSDTEDDGKPKEDQTDLTVADNNGTNETLRAWFQRITQMQNEIQKKLVHSATTTLPSATSSMPSPSLPVVTQPARVVKYQDLPYMGEMTLDNSKPRRGRKPKKADICHLIYKNYGTIFPGTPNPKSLVQRSDNKKSNDSGGNKGSDVVEGLNRSDVQHRIISSLLEKRLTQESKRQQQQQQQLLGASRKTKTSTSARKDASEPLNLCIRDLDHLQLRLNQLNNNVQAKETKVEIKQEPREASDDEVEFVHETPSPALLSTFDFKLPADLASSVLPQDIIKTPENGVPPGGYVYWPNAGVFIHPMALQQQLMSYQKMGAGEPDVPPSMDLPDLRQFVPKAPTKPQSKSETSEDEAPAESNKSKRISNASTFDKSSPAKRKRSAIFIPPIPADNQNNPATEVSICKFKFTGGAKPSLQEKKMLSVDSGGNFRYYSGTGDKSMRGYEFFPRETLQQQISNAQGSSTGAFLQASGERIYPSSPVDFTSKVNEFMLTPELRSSQQPAPDTAASKKRKSRKSLQREKLEQTFKEKGFLIQTQQLESAEGATYCKFRQLRKFTRYLFRSWKDYLPGNVGDNRDAALATLPPDCEAPDEETVATTPPTKEQHDMTL